MATMTVTGEVYHKKKFRFKKLLKELNLQWMGTMDFPKWQTPGLEPECVIKATFIRDEIKNETISGSFVIEGDGAVFKAVINWMNREFLATVNIPSEVDRRMVDYNLFKSIHEPNLDREREKGCPGFLLAKMGKDWEDKRKKQILLIGLTDIIIDNHKKGFYPESLPDTVDEASLLPPKVTIEFSKDDLEWAKKNKEREDAQKQEAREHIQGRRTVSKRGLKGEPDQTVEQRQAKNRLKERLRNKTSTLTPPEVV